MVVRDLEDRLIVVGHDHFNRGRSCVVNKDVSGKVCTRIISKQDERIGGRVPRGKVFDEVDWVVGVVECGLEAEHRTSLIVDNGVICEQNAL